MTHPTESMDAFAAEFLAISRDVGQERFTAWLNAYRAEVRATTLSEGADAIDATYTGFGIDRYVRHGADLLRRMAEEARS
jgi:hypothetical protein